MTCVPQVDEEPVKKEEEKKKELKPWEIDTVPDGEDPPDKEWTVTVRVVDHRYYYNVKAPDPYWAVESYHDYDYNVVQEGHEEVVAVEEGEPSSPPP